MKRGHATRMTPPRTRVPNRLATRLRAAVFALGALLFTAALLLHPLLLDPADEALAYRSLAADPLWAWIHWGALAGITLWTLPLAADGTPAARQAFAVALALWVAVLAFEATALPHLASAGIPGFWAWTLAVGYLAAAFDGVGLALRDWPGNPLPRAAGVMVAAASLLAYAAPAAAVPTLLVAGVAAMYATVATAAAWW